MYGTVTADGKKVTSAGRVASCMKCHETKATRLFGLPSLFEREVSKTRAICLGERQELIYPCGPNDEARMTNDE